ncbi:sugar ABC transporter permease [Spiractinospora alimapuensis]|uniref:carbohydrate ABC transporter permease n=1 Tax=Spiractinospora alimapuensis TaxID=2820884 RepID=UPI001F2F9500|nr:sugar ABC transporter permease [Spiractinospora alimapuensis]QVQ52222.1 sugar ABC transporter permease [Spiractinospora alimapuensis]
MADAPPDRGSQHTRRVRRGGAGVRFRRWFHQRGFWLMLMAPVLLYLLLAQYYPLSETVRLSFFDHRLTSPEPQRFTGLDNYRQLFFEDRVFWSIVGNSLIWVLGSTGLQLATGTLFAVVLNQSVRLRGLWRGLLMVPWVMPVVVVAIVWRWIFDGEFGLANHYLLQAGILSEPVVWLGSETWVWVVLLLAGVWMGTPFVTLLVLAALQGIPDAVLEAADVDGASRWQRFWFVILPMLRPTLFIAGMIALVVTWFKFELIWALTNGGPGFATSILPTYVYSRAFQDFDFGLAGAVATTAMVIVVLVAGLVAGLFARRRG